MASCKDCKYFRVKPLEKNGECHYHPPKLVQIPGRNLAGQITMQFGGMFVPVQPEWWCGQFEIAITVPPVSRGEGELS